MTALEAGLAVVVDLLVAPFHLPPARGLLLVAWAGLFFVHAPLAIRRNHAVITAVETRAVEPLDQLLRKGETSKEVYVLRRLQAERGMAVLGSDTSGTEVTPMPEVRTADATLYCEVDGEGEPVTVLAHGLTNNRNELAAFTSLVPGTKVRFDFRGHGFSRGRPRYGRLPADVRTTNAAVQSGAVVALTLEDRAGAVSLQHGWVSHDLSALATPIVGSTWALATAGRWLSRWTA